MIPGIVAGARRPDGGSLRSRVQALYPKYSAMGGMWDLSDPSILFQNSNATGAVSDNDPIGYATDLSGKGTHIGQATSNKRPLFDVNDGAVFDGSDDCLVTLNTLDLSACNKAVIGAGYKKIDDATRMVMEFGPAYGRRRFFLLSGPDTTRWQSFYAKGETDSQPVAYFAAARPNEYGAHIGRTSFSAPLTEVWWNGSKGVDAASTHGSSTLSSQTLNIGSRNNGAGLVLDSGMRRAIVLAVPSAGTAVSNSDVELIRQWLMEGA